MASEKQRFYWVTFLPFLPVFDGCQYGRTGAFFLVLNRVPYLDPRSRSRHASDQDRADAALQAWLILIQKWRTIPDGLALIAKESNPLGFWRRLVMESRAVHLPLRP
jgi:hypothetical protein